MNTMFGKIKRGIKPVAVFAMGLLLCFNSVVLAEPLPGEAIIGDYELTIEAAGRTYRFAYPEIDFVGGEIYLKNATEIADGIYLDTLVKPVDAKAEIYPERENPFVFHKEKDGYGIDCKKLLDDIKVALYARKRNIFVKREVIKPKVSLSDIKRKPNFFPPFRQIILLL